MRCSPKEPSLKRLRTNNKLMTLNHENELERIIKTKQTINHKEKRKTDEQIICTNNQ